MKTQIVIIGGGNGFETEGQYLNYLRTRPISLDSYRTTNNWKNSLQDRLGGDFDVIISQMPNKDNARYSDWKIWFERIVALLDENVIFIGHSLGGLFLAKYLSENTYPTKIRATFLLAAPYAKSGQDLLPQFALTNDLSGFDRQGGMIFIYHSTDDEIVPVLCARQFARALPAATIRSFDRYGHLNQKEFPELIDDLKACSIARPIT